MPVRKPIKQQRQRKPETRVLTTSRFELRKAADGSRSISGYAATFNNLSEDLGGFKEEIAKGAFQRSLNNNPDVLCLYGHDQNQILGRVSSGTLTIAEDNIGLRFTCRLPDTSWANDLIALMERNDVSKCSFGFSCPEGGDSWENVNGQLIRTLNQVILYEVSVVGQPAYSQSSVDLRSLRAAVRKGGLNLDPSLDDIIFGKADDDSDDPSDSDDGNESDDSEDSERCGCRCGECRDSNCDQCFDIDCDSETCSTSGCPVAERNAQMALLLRLSK